MNTGRIGSLLVACGLTVLTGCSQIVKHTVYEIKGADADFKHITDMTPSGLESCNSVEFAPATTSTGGRVCTPLLLTAYDETARDVAAKINAKARGGEPVLRVEIDVLYFQKKGLTSGALMLSRVRMNSGGRALVDTLVVTESKAFSAGSEKALAKATAQDIGKFIRKHMKMAEEKETEQSGDNKPKE